MGALTTYYLIRKWWLVITFLLVSLLVMGCSQSPTTNQPPSSPPSSHEVVSEIAGPTATSPQEQTQEPSAPPAATEESSSPTTPTPTTAATPKTTDNGESIPQVPHYPDATPSAVPDDVKTAFGIPAAAACQGYTTSASPEDVADWYRQQMNSWSLVDAESFAPPDRPGTMVYTQRYRQGESGVFMAAQSSPREPTFILITAGSWEMIEHLATPGAGGPPGPDHGGMPPPGTPPEGQDSVYAELGTGPVTFTVSPIDPKYLKRVEPLGGLNALTGHTYPTDHGSLEPNGIREVMAPADGIITELQFNGESYRLVITHTNTFRSWFDHLASVEPTILAQAEAAGGKLLPGTELRGLNITVTAGQVIGTGPKGAVGVPWGVTDEDVTLNFIHPEKYGRMAHSVHFIPYCSPSLAEALLAKLPRKAEPRWGKIDFDEPGKLVGNWILEDASGEGLLEESAWERQLAFVYDKYDPSQLRVAVGGVLNVPSGSGVFAVVGNAPDPATVTTESGMVIYRLRGIAEFGETGITATVIAEVVGEEKIKVEGFPGHPANPQFTANAKYYTR